MVAIADPKIHMPPKAIHILPGKNIKIG